MHQRYLTTLSTCTYSQYTEYYLLSYSSKGNSPYSFFVHTKLLVGCWIVSVSMSLYAYVPNWMQEILIISRQKICAKAIHIKPYSLKFVIDCFKIQEIGEKAVERGLYTLEYAPEWYRMQEMCETAVERMPFALDYVLDQHRTQEMCSKAVHFP